jgi:SET domain-containing protein
MDVPVGLELKPSSIHGLGIFAIKNFIENEFIGDYIGEAMTKAEFKTRYGNDIRYTYWTKQNFPNTKVYSAKEKRNFITYINERRDPNVFLKNRKLYAKCNIVIGDELFLRYDNKYNRDYTLD